jgi:predicted regulator of Ras-like GTPase activity (Roadblock/LC7/MglB family)
MDVSNLKQLVKDNSSIGELCLMSSEGDLIEFITSYSINEAEKNRIAASIMASIALSTRVISNLVRKEIKYINLKSNAISIIIIFTKNQNYLYIKTKTKHTSKVLKSINKIVDFV